MLSMQSIGEKRVDRESMEEESKEEEINIPMADDEYEDWRTFCVFHDTSVFKHTSEFGPNEKNLKSQFYIGVVLTDPVAKKLYDENPKRFFPSLGQLEELCNIKDGLRQITCMKIEKTDYNLLMKYELEDSFQATRGSYRGLDQKLLKTL